MKNEMYSIKFSRDKVSNTDATVDIEVKFDVGKGLTANELAKQITETVLIGSQHVYGVVIANIDSGHIEVEG